MDFSKLQATSKITDQWSYPLAAANRSGLLEVSDGHKLSGKSTARLTASR